MEIRNKTKKYKGKTKYRVLASAVGVNLLAGFIYTWSILSKSLIEDLNWTSAQASLPYTLFTISFVTAMVIFGKIQDVKGPRLIASIGCILMGSGLIMSGFFTSPKIMIITVGIIAGGGVGMMTVATSPPVVKWFPPSEKGRVTGFVVAGAGLSSVYYSPIASYLITTVGIQKTFIYMGLVALIFSTLIAQGLTNPPKDYNANNSINAKKENLNDYRWQEMLKSLDFYKIWFMLIFSSAAGHMIIGHLSTIAKIQAKWKSGFILIIIISIFNTIGRLSGGYISDKVGRMKFMKVVFIIQALNLILFINYTGKISLIFGTIVAGACYGTLFSVFPSTISDLFGLKNFGVNYGLMFTGWGLGGLIGPMIAASIVDNFNNYYIAYIISFILLIISIILTNKVDVSKNIYNANMKIEPKHNIDVDY